MQDSIQNLVGNLLSDDNGKQAIKSIITTLSENSESQQQNNPKRKTEFEKNISLINTIMPFLPQKNVKKAHLIIKILEVAILLDEIKHDAIN